MSCHGSFLPVVALACLPALSPLAAGPCPEASAIPSVRTVQASRAFAETITPAWHTAIVAMGGEPQPLGSSIADWWLATLCRGMRADSSPLFTRGAIVVAPFLHGVEVSFLRFAVVGDTVVLLNRVRSDGRVTAALDLETWNRWLVVAPLAQPLSTPPLAEAYVCLLRSLDAGRPLDGCRGSSPPLSEAGDWRSGELVFDRAGRLAPH